MGSEGTTESDELIAIMTWHHSSIGLSPQERPRAPSCAHIGLAMILSTEKRQRGKRPRPQWPESISRYLRSFGL
jgi:hypothetical protein